MSDTLVRPTGTIQLTPSTAVLQDSTLEISWCLSKSMMDELATLDATKPMLLITVISVHPNEPDFSVETSRYFVPAALGKTVIGFSRAGLNRVMATVVWSKTGNERKLRYELLGRDSANSFTQRMLSYDRTSFTDADSFDDKNRARHPGSGSFEVDVPEGMFARQPREFWKLFQSKFYRNQPFDQCHSRKRFLCFGWWFLPLFLLVTIPARLVYVAVRLFLGVVPTNWSPIIHPFKEEIADTHGRDKQYSFWFCHKSKDRWGDSAIKARAPWFWLFNPPVQLFLFLTMFIVSSWHVDRGTGETEQIEALLGWSFAKCVGVVVAGELALAAGIGVLALLGIGIYRILPRKWKDSYERREAARIADERRRQEAIRVARAAAPKELQYLAPLVCNTDGPTPTRNPRDLPTNLRFKLWFDQTKQKVCKPYQR